jgi:predicted DNA-binding protein (UPF0251 family)
LIQPVKPPRADVPAVALAVAAEAIAALPAFSSPEDMAQAALDAAWPLARANQRITEYEVEVARQLIGHYRLTQHEAAEQLGVTHERVRRICRRGRIVVGNAGRRGRNRWQPTTEGLAELVAVAKQRISEQ